MASNIWLDIIKVSFSTWWNIKVSIRDKEDNNNHEMVNMFTYQMSVVITLFIDIFGVNIQKHEQVRQPKVCNKILQIDQHGHIHLNQESSDV
jgi:hypothetical protein